MKLMQLSAIQRQSTVVRGFLLAWFATVLAVPLLATERLFTYSYEPETHPAGVLELEQWVTLRTQRTSAGIVQQQNYNRWELRSEFEYGVTDLYTVGLYLNFKNTSYRDMSLSPPEDFSQWKFAGVSVENRFMLLNPATRAVGLTLYLEPGYSGEDAFFEQKIILGQRHGDWKWAVNLIHETEWEDNFHKTVGEVEGTVGLARMLSPRWALGLELRSHSEIVEYKIWENTALFLGPVVHFRRDKWWTTLTVLPQLWGHNFEGNPDNNTSLDLSGHERVNVRLIFGIDL